MNATGRCNVILVAAGQGRRFGGEANKVFALLKGEPVWVHAARTLRSHPEVGKIVLVVAAADRTLWDQLRHQAWISKLNIQLTEGGQERVDSVAAGLKTLPPSVDDEWVATHDAARPCLLARDLDTVLQAAKTSGAAMLARPLMGTIKRVGDQQSVSETIDRRNLWEALTPQVFRRDWLVAAYARWRGRPVTDDAHLVQLAGYQVQVIEGAPFNIKVTSPMDLELAEAILSGKDFESHVHTNEHR